MRTTSCLIFIILFTSAIHSQTDEKNINIHNYDNSSVKTTPSDSNCSKIFDRYSGCYFIDKAPKMLTNSDSLKSWLKYPQEALAHKIEGTVYVKILLDTTGLPICEMVIKGLPYGCNEEAIRLTKRLRFSPAMQIHKKVILPFVIPINFKLTPSKN